MSESPSLLSPLSVAACSVVTLLTPRTWAPGVRTGHRIMRMAYGHRFMSIRPSPIMSLTEPFSRDVCVSIVFVLVE